MSKPVKNEEIEDILSSIRRLVSEDPGTRAAPQPTPDAPPRIERLVLTPSLRVQEPTVSAAPSEPVMLTDPSVALPAATRPAAAPKASLLALLVQEEVARAMEQDGPPIHHPETDPSAEAHETGDESGHELGHDGVPDGASAELTGSGPTADAFETMLDDLEDGAVRGSAGEGVETDSFEGDEVLARKIAALEALVRGRARGAVEPAAEEALTDWDTSVPESAADAGEAIPAPKDNGADRLSPAHADMAAPTAGGGDEAPADPVHVALKLVPTAADASPVAAADHADETLADETLADETLIEWEDHAPVASPQRDVFPDPSEAVAQPVPDLSGRDQPEADEDANAPLLDEATLREMVSDIVRQELQGVLGERITRNVRKLVRREIHRVMMTQDFD